jgi:hypothetical protein
LSPRPHFSKVVWSDLKAAETNNDKEPRTLSLSWPCCGGRMIIIETF